jgi:hypothetical protein
MTSSRSTDNPGEAQHEPVPVGTRITTGARVPRAGTWEIVDHPECPGDGTLRELAADAVAPRCRTCQAEVTWQLSHLAPSVAADHRDVGRLP